MSSNNIFAYIFKGEIISIREQKPSRQLFSWFRPISAQFKLRGQITNFHCSKLEEKKSIRPIFLYWTASRAWLGISLSYRELNKDKKTCVQKLASEMKKCPVQKFQTRSCYFSNMLAWSSNDKFSFVQADELLLAVRVVRRTLLHTNKFQ